MQQQRFDAGHEPRGVVVHAGIGGKEHGHLQASGEPRLRASTHGAMLKL